jgi:putative transposase
VKFKAIAQWALNYSVVDLCSALRVSTGAYYHWRRKPAKLISSQELSLYREAKRLFNETRSGMGYVRLCRGLNKAGFTIGETRTKTIMRKLNLVCSQRRAYKCTTNSHHNNTISTNLLDQKFNPAGANQIWSTDITYLPTRQGWTYLAIVMDLYARKIVGWAMSKRMTTALIVRALEHAHALRKPPRGLLHHSDRGAQYTSHAYREKLAKYGMQSSMSGKGNCYDNAVVERFFGSLKHEWLANVTHLTRDGITNDVNKYIRYYNGTRMHSTLDYVSPNEYENSLINVCN